MSARTGPASSQHTPDCPGPACRCSNAAGVPTVSPALLTVEAAAVALSTTPTALRARCRRAARRFGRDVIAHLGPGVDALKFGRSWRIRITPVTEATTHPR